MASQNNLIQDLTELLSDLREYLSYQKELGIEGFPTTGEGISDAEMFTISTINDSASGVDKFGEVGLQTIRTKLGDCKRCKLHFGRKNIVFGMGNENARLVFVGEAPGRDEDIKGEPFIGKAGQLFTRIIKAINLNRKDVYITNIIKCRPPGNRDPEPDEIAACELFLTEQIMAIKPEIICALGAFAARTLLKKDQTISELRGRFHDYHGIKLIPTYHPAFLLRNPSFKRPVWEDIQMIQKECFDL